MDTKNMRNVGGVYLQVDSNGVPGKTVLRSFLSIRDEHLPGIFGFCAPIDVSNVHTPQKIFEDTNCLIQLKEPNEYSNGMSWFQLSCTDRESLFTAYNSLINTSNVASNIIDGGLYNYPI